MTTERTLDPSGTLKTSILNGDQFLYAHLIKFESAKRTVLGAPSKKASDYHYITDGSFDISYDDGSTTNAGVSHGAQTYVANQVLSVGAIQDTTDAKASTMSLQIAGEALNTTTLADQPLTWTSNATSITTTGEDFVSLGFREGDQVRLVRVAQWEAGITVSQNDVVGYGDYVYVAGSSGTTGTEPPTHSSGAVTDGNIIWTQTADSNQNKKFTITTFSNNNKTVNGTFEAVLVGNVTNTTLYKLELCSTHITGLFEDKRTGTYANYINREVLIYKAHIKPDDGSIIGAPYCVFRGIISKVKIAEDPAKNSKLTWTLTSHWGDFLRVNGRLTSDSEHRALKGDNVSDVSALTRVEYGSDFGFMHSEQAINIIAIYSTMETRYKMKSSGLFGLKKKLVEYQVEVDRDVDLRFNLEAKYLPVIYGVQRTDSIPVFADSKFNDAGEIYVAYAICEGEVAGLYDMYIDDQSRICIDKNDEDTRGQQTSEKTIDVVCEGRMDLGETLSSKPAFISAGRQKAKDPIVMALMAFGVPAAYIDEFLYSLNPDPNLTKKYASGVTHEKMTDFKFPIEATAIFHAGRAHQRADDMLVAVAEAGAENANNGFKLQAEEDVPAIYWSKAHRMLDTSYLTVKYKVAEGDISIPEIDFVVRGRELEQYNYDYSYESVPDAQGFDGFTSASQHGNFQIADVVDIYNTSGTKIKDNAIIMDKYEYINSREETIIKYRFDDDPRNTSTVKTFIMVPNTATSLIAAKTITGITQANPAVVTSDSHGFTSGQRVTITNVTGMTEVNNTSFFVKNPTTDTFQLYSDSGLSTAVDSTGFTAHSGNTGRANHDKYQFETHDYSAHSGVVPKRLAETLTTVSDDGNATIASDGSGTTGVTVTLTDEDLQQVNTLAQEIVQWSMMDPNEENWIKESEAREIAGAHLFGDAWNSGTNTVTSNNIENSTESITSVSEYVIKNAIKLQNTASTTDDYYKGQTIKVTQQMLDGSKRTQTRKIVKYLGARQIALTGDLVPTIASSSDVSGTFTIAARSRDPQTAITLNTVSGLQFGDVISQSSINGFETVEDARVSILEINPAGAPSNTIALSGRVLATKVGVEINFKRGGEDETTTATVEPFDLAPRLNDSYEILPVGDKKVSINPAIQLLDYLTDKRYGKGLDIDEDINLDSFLSSARLCDTRSDVTIFANTGTTDSFAVGDKYQYTNSQTAIDTKIVFWQGTLKSKTTRTFTPTGGSAYTVVELNFTECIGKLVTKWENWKTFAAQELVWKQHIINDIPVSKVHRPTSATNYTTLAEGTDAVDSTTGIVIRKLSGSGPSTFNPWFRDYTDQDGRTNASDHNPLVKRWNTATNTPSLIGYSLYDSDNVKYWRNCGWQSQHQREVTRHQTNATIRTEVPVFDNVNSMLEHFNGILRYVNKKYMLDVETTLGSYLPPDNDGNETDPRILNQDDIIGAISVEDAGLKGSCNTVSVSIPDPQIRYDKRSVTYFDSNYLKEDRGVPKKKDIKTPLISNYFNARINAEQYLKQSRYSKKINFQVGPKGLLLLTGTLIKLTYPRFGFDNKAFRISNLNIKEDCTVQITAFEHEDSTYLIEDKGGAVAPVETSGASTANPTPAVPTPRPPSGLTATTNLNSKIVLNWTNNSQLQTSDLHSVSDWSTEIWYNNAQSASTTSTDFPQGYKPLVTGIQADQYEHNLPEISANTSFYYWIRHVKVATLPSGLRTGVASIFEPVNTGNGVQGTATPFASAATGIVYLYKLVDQGVSAPTIESDFPTVRVNLEAGTAHFNKITSIPSGNGSAAVVGTTPNYEIRDTGGDLSGWFTYKPTITNGKVLYVVAATSNAVGAIFDDIARTEWSAAIQDSGSHGLSTSVVTLFQTNNSSSAPSTPDSAETFNFSTGVLSTNSSNVVATGSAAYSKWSQIEKVTAANQQYLWKTTAAATAVTAVSGQTSDSIATGEWSTPSLFHVYAPPGPTGPAGSPGSSGQANAVVFAYQRSASTLTTNPGAVTVSLTGTTSGTITTGSLANGWSKTIPSGTNPLYVCAATAAGTGSTDTIAANEWSSPVILTENGINSATVFLYQNNNTGSAPSNLPSGNVTYTFATSSIGSFGTNANGWSITNPGVSNSNRYLWVTTATAAATTATDVIADSEWATAKLLATFGDEGKRSVQGYIYFTTTSNSNPFASGGTGTYNFSQGQITGNLNPNVTYQNFPYEVDVGSTNYYWSARYTYTDSSAGTTSNTVTATITAAVAHTSFTGVVTFTEGTGGNAGSLKKNNSAITSIDGGQIHTGSISANELAISANTNVTSGPRMFFNTQTVLGVQQNAIEIFDASNVLRVKIGKLA